MRTLALMLLAGCAPGFSGSTERFTLSSREVSVWLPTRYDPKAEPLPVVFQLDGETQAEPVAAFAEQRGLEVIVVGLSSQGRFRDDTPTEDARFAAETGQHEPFAQFLRDELIPRVEADFHASPDGRTLMGHSLGGLAVISSFLSQRGGTLVFSNFAAASPSLWWDSGVALQREAAGPRVVDSRTKLFIATAELESSDIVLYSQELAARFEAYPGLRVKRTTYSDMGHTWSWEKAYPDALEFFFAQ